MSVGQVYVFGRTACLVVAVDEHGEPTLVRLTP